MPLERSFCPIHYVSSVMWEDVKEFDMFGGGNLDHDPEG
jgi:hypothetical protein